MAVLQLLILACVHTFIEHLENSNWTIFTPRRKTNMKVKLLKLVFYSVFLIIVLEHISWFQGTPAVVHPAVLNTKQLKEILLKRGISYAGVYEKDELIQLVELSGKPTIEEFPDIFSVDEIPDNTMHFTSQDQFHEEVEKRDDVAWILQIDALYDDPPFLPSSKVWNEVMSKVSKFGIRMGIVNCTLARKLCRRQDWSTSKVMLILPYSRRGVLVHNRHIFVKPLTTEYIVNSLQEKMTSYVKEIDTEKQLHYWMNYSTDYHESVRVFLFLSQLDCPMFYSALAVKFNGKILFATVDVRNYYLRNSVKNMKVPTYMVLSPEMSYTYGSRMGEFPNFKSMQLFLSTFVLERKHVFWASLLIANILAGFELCFVYGKFKKYFSKYISSAVECNSYVLALWLGILIWEPGQVSLALFFGFFYVFYLGLALWKKYRYFAGIIYLLSWYLGQILWKLCESFANIAFLEKIWRLLNFTYAASLIRNSYRFSYSCTFFIISFVVFSSLVDYLILFLKHNSLFLQVIDLCKKYMDKIFESRWAKKLSSIGEILHYFAVNSSESISRPIPVPISEEGNAISQDENDISQEESYSSQEESHSSHEETLRNRFRHNNTSLEEHSRTAPSSQNNNSREGDFETVPRHIHISREEIPTTGDRPYNEENLGTTSSHTSQSENSGSAASNTSIQPEENDRSTHRIIHITQEGNVRQIHISHEENNGTTSRIIRISQENRNDDNPSTPRTRIIHISQQNNVEMSPRHNNIGSNASSDGRMTTQEDLTVTDIMTQLLVIRLSLPELLQQPVVPVDCMQGLPQWKYQGSSSTESTDSLSADDGNSRPDAIGNTTVNSASTNLSSQNPPESSLCDAANVTVDSNPDPSVSSPVKDSNTDPPKSPDCKGIPEGMRELPECAICLEKYTEGDDLCGLPCGHNFHVKCITIWLTKHNNSCPFCRLKIRP